MRYLFIALVLASWAWARPALAHDATRDRLAGAGLAVEYHMYAGGHTYTPTPEVLGWFTAWLARGGAD
jgi:hypothetical protein